MSRKDHHAASLIRELRVNQGLTPEALSYLIHRTNPSFSVSARTIRRVERDGMVPSVRVMFGIAQTFEMVPSQIWRSAGRASSVTA